MKQKIVIWVSMNNDRCRSKALRIAVGISGVERTALTGQGKDHVEVEGEGIDSVELTRRLRKNVAHAVIVSVGEVKNPDPAPAQTPTPPPVEGFSPPPCYGFPRYRYCEVVEPPTYGPSCNIL